MPDLISRYVLDIAQAREAFGQIRELARQVSRESGKGDGLSSQARSAKEVERAMQRAGAATQQVGANMAAGETRAARMAAVVHTIGGMGHSLSGINAGLTAIRDMYGQIRGRAVPAMQQTAAATHQVTTATQTADKSSRMTFSTFAKGALVAGTLALAITRVHAAWRGLANEKQPKLQLPSTVGGGGGMGGGGGSLLGRWGPGLLLAGAVAGLGAAVTKQISTAIQEAGTYETLEVSLSVMTGGMDTARKVLTDIKALTEKTPLRFGDVADAGRGLMAFGASADTVGETLRKIGDVSTAIQAPIGEIAEIYGKAMVQGRMYAMDIRQLMRRGIPVIQEFADILGVGTDQVRKLASEGEIGFPLLEQAFTNMTSKGGQFFGMMEKQSLTVPGLWSTLLDRITNAQRAMGKPINDAIRPILARAMEMAGQLEAHAMRVGEAIAVMIDHVRALFETLSFSEIFQLAGLELQAVLFAAINLVAKFFGALMAGFAREDFTESLSAKLKNVAAVFKIEMLSAVEAIFRSLADLGGKVGDRFGIAAGSVARARIAAMMTQEDEWKRQAAAGIDPEKYKKIFGEEFGKVPEMFRQADADVARREEMRRRVAEQAAANIAARHAEKSGGGAPKPEPEPEKLLEDGGGIAGTISGVFQSAINLAMGKSPYELIASESKKTNELLNAVQKNTSDAATAAKETARNTRQAPTVEVEVVPAFA